MLDLKDVLTYALGGSVPEGFLEHLVQHRSTWDDTFRRKLDELAYEFRPDLAVWELEVNEQGQLTETRLPLLSS